MPSSTLQLPMSRNCRRALRPGWPRAAVLAPIRLAGTGASRKKLRTQRHIRYTRRYASRRGPEQHTYPTPPAQTFYAIGLLIGFAISQTGLVQRCHSQRSPRCQLRAAPDDAGVLTTTVAVVCVGR